MLITLAPLILGLAAWAVNIISLCTHRKNLGAVSWCLCACALWFPLNAWDRWAQGEDVAALLDCAHAYALCAGVLILGNLLISGLALLLRHYKK